MEGGHGEAPEGGLPAQGGGQALLHLPGGPAGKGDGGDLPGGGALPQQVEDAGGEGLGLAGARPGHHGHCGACPLRGPALLRVQLAGGEGRGLLLFGAGLLGGGGPSLFFGGLGLRRPEEGGLALQGLPLRRGEEHHVAEGPVVAGDPLHLAQPQPPDALGHRRARHPLDVTEIRLAQDVKLAAQLLEHGLVPGLGLFACFRGAGAGGDDLGQGGQALEGLLIGAGLAQGAVRQLLHPVLHPDGQLLPAHGAQAAQGFRLLGGEAHPAVPVAV